MDFRAVTGARLTRDQARVIGRRLKWLEEQHGTVTPELVVRDARSAASPLHSFFEWDNARAAGQFRITQARYLIRSIELVVRNARGQETRMRAFHSVMTDSNEGRGYVALDVVASRVDYTQQIVSTAQRELQGWMERYEKYSALRRLVVAVRRAMREALA